MQPARARRTVGKAIGPIGLEFTPDLVEVLARIARYLAGLADVIASVARVSRDSLRRATLSFVVRSLLLVTWIVQQDNPKPSQERVPMV